MPEHQINIGLQSETIRRIAGVIRQNPKFNEAVVFGSRAKGVAEPGSDIDIALTGSEINSNDLLELYARLDELDLPYYFDLVIYERITEPALKEHIDKWGVGLFGL